MNQHKSLFFGSPHSGEKIPFYVDWLQSIDQRTLLQDVDRFVDQLYKPAIDSLGLEFKCASYHRYVVDLNRFENQYDLDAVLDAPYPSGTFPKGLHWSRTTQNEPLIVKPMTQDLHQKILKECYWPFHNELANYFAKTKQNKKTAFYIDLHSMPSVGTKFHADPGQERPEVVISDFEGKSCSQEFLQRVASAFTRAGLQVSINKPYKGEGITQKFGQPHLGQEVVQVELRRNLYMDESSKEKNSEFYRLQKQLKVAIEDIFYRM